DTSPVTLTLSSRYDWTDKISQTVLQKAHDKFPYITINVIKQDKGSMLQDLITNNTPPDLMFGPSGDLKNWQDLAVAADLTPLMQNNKLDLNRFNPSWVEDIQHRSAKGTFMALPYSSYSDVIFYNKDIFDKFAISYPKDGMTWPELLDLAKKVTRNEGGTQYRGYEPRSFSLPASQYPLLSLDPQTDQAQVTTDKWANVMQFFKDVYQINGNMPSDWSLWLKGNQGETEFTKTRTLAMWENGGGAANGFPTDLNFDMIALPTWPDAPNQSQSIGGKIFGISTSSQHKDQAFKFIQYMASDEIQDFLSRNVSVPAIISPTILQDYGKDSTQLQGKNLNAVPYELTHNKPAVLPANRSIYDDKGIYDLTTLIPDIATGKKDINTALREATDQINKDVGTAKQQK
ncbi:MAG: extracellular solute-binding protein family 1, partial [Bacilli bacterium]|nr:extracellular solute-binding protein family 1 [Bacilli bacterium]